MEANVDKPPTMRAAFSTGEISDMPALLGITYGFGKALPKIIQDCLIQPMTTETHLGKKLEAEAKKLGMTATQIANYFGIKPPSVYSWYAKGSIHHKHFYKLVQLTGKPLEWWFDFPDQGDAASQPKYSMFANNLAVLFDSMPDDLNSKLEALMGCSRLISEIGTRALAQQKPVPSVFPQIEKRNE